MDEDLYNWIDSHNFSKPKRSLNRDFADGVMFAELLKEHFPDKVELHNYSSQNSISGKLNNLTLLNRKVLSKIQLPQLQNNLEKIASGIPGAAEQLLIAIKKKIDESIPNTERSKSTPVYNREQSDDNIITINENETCTDLIVKIPVKIQKDNGRFVIEEHEMLPKSIMINVIKELEEKKEAVQILQQKVQYLENKMKIKDERIAHLLKQLKLSKIPVQVDKISSPAGENVNTSS